jgi:hypothetical protein
MLRSFQVACAATAGAALSLSSLACSPKPPPEDEGTGGGQSTGGLPGSGGASSGGGSTSSGSSGSGGTLGSGGDPWGGLGSFTGRDAGSKGSGGACGSTVIDTSVEEVVTPGNVLIIFDQSESMNRIDFNNQARWLASSDALIGALVPNRDVLRIGAVFFPSTEANTRGDCDIAAVCRIDDTACSNPQIPFTGGTQFIDNWAAHWQSNPLRRGTPIDSGLVRGDEALSSTTLAGTTVVIFVTDGEPTCSPNSPNFTALPAKWLAAGIKTYVIGLPGSGAGTLQTLATAGGTQNFYLPTDGAQLQQQISQITSTIVKRSFNGCEIVFKSTPPDPTKVVLVVTDQQGQKFSVTVGPEGWELSPDAKKGTLKGATCTDALAGRFASVGFEFGCPPPPPLR